MSKWDKKMQTRGQNSLKWLNADQKGVEMDQKSQKRDAKGFNFSKKLVKGYKQWKSVEQGLTRSKVVKICHIWRKWGYKPVFLAGNQDGEK